MYEKINKNSRKNYFYETVENVFKWIAQHIGKQASLQLQNNYIFLN